jgi:cytochrome c553
LKQYSTQDYSMKKSLLPLLVASLFLGCSSEQQSEQTTPATTPATTEKKSVTQSLESIKEEAANIMEQSSQQIQDSTQKAINGAKKELEKASEQASQMMQSASQDIKNEVAKATTTVQKTITPSGATLYAAKCASCHGADGGRSAMNASKIIKGWDKTQIISALDGYKAGTYGGAMKGVMSGQASALTPEEIDALATYISKL